MLPEKRDHTTSCRICSVNVLHAHFVCKPCRTENNIPTVHPVVSYLSICPSLSLILSLLFPLFVSPPPSALSLLSSPLLCASPSLSTSADAYHSLSMCVCVRRTRASACQKPCILFIQSKHGPGCCMPCDSFTHTHTRPRTQS